MDTLLNVTIPEEVHSDSFDTVDLDSDQDVDEKHIPFYKKIFWCFCKV
jgi:hypothetical protein